jgi:8-oxo-dGTP pyrophosphatase MutT (NUDIX family)
MFVFLLSPDGRQVLLVHRHRHPDDAHFGKYNGLGGKLDPGEDIVAGLCREVREESGLVALLVSVGGLSVYVSRSLAAPARFQQGHFTVARRFVVGQFIARWRRVPRARRRWQAGHDWPDDEPCAGHPCLTQAGFEGLVPRPAQVGGTPWGRKATTGPAGRVTGL